MINLNTKNRNINKELLQMINQYIIEEKEINNFETLDETWDFLLQQEWY
ncbi:MAG: hypothetical protein ACRCXZ_01565 [Patescibacteria group bacterium]